MRLGKLIDTKEMIERPSLLSRHNFIDYNKVIKKQPRLLCVSCKGHGITKIINFIKRFL
jgi:hypothetical protein